MRSAGTRTNYLRTHTVAMCWIEEIMSPNSVSPIVTMMKDQFVSKSSLWALRLAPISDGCSRRLCGRRVHGTPISRPQALRSRSFWDGRRFRAWQGGVGGDKCVIHYLNYLAFWSHLPSILLLRQQNARPQPNRGTDDGITSGGVRPNTQPNAPPNCEDEANTDV
jgi:hypothetical protein